MEKSVKSTFNLPNKIYYTGAIKGDGKTLGFTDGTNTYGLEVSGNNPNNYLFRTGDYGKSVGASGGDGSTGTGGITYGITTDSSKSGMIVEPDSQIKLCIKY